MNHEASSFRCKGGREFKFVSFGLSSFFKTGSIQERIYYFLLLALEFVVPGTGMFLQTKQIRLNKESRYCERIEATQDDSVV